MNLIVTPNLPDPDAAYAAWLGALKGLTEAESHALNARLVLILINHVGDMDLMAEALALATMG